MIHFYFEKNIFINKNKIDFVLEFLFSTLGYSYEIIDSLDNIGVNKIILYYGLTEPTHKTLDKIIKDNILFFIPVDLDVLDTDNYQHDYLKSITRIVKLKEEIPIISRNKFDYPVVIKRINDNFYGKYYFDLIGNLFFLLMGNDLFNMDYLDHNGKEIDESNILISYHNLPIVNHLLWFFDSFLDESLNFNENVFLLRKDFWPASEKMAVCITHTVDKLQKWTVKKIFKTLLESMFLIVIFKWNIVYNNIFSLIKFILTNIEPYWNFEEINELEKKNNVKSTFFVGTENKQPKNIDYDLKDRDLKRELINIKKSGSEIGLLASYQSSKTDIVSMEKTKLSDYLGEKIFGARQTHYRYNHLRTIEYQQKARFLYDSSHTYNDKQGFKNGVAFPFRKKYFDFISDLYILPVSYNDEKLKVSKYNTLSFDKAKEVLKKILISLEEVNGLAVCDFAISNFTDIKYNIKLFEYLLALTKDKDIFRTNCRELVNWWKIRNSVEVTRDDCNIKVFFPERVNQISFKLTGKHKIKSITGVRSDITEGNKIRFYNVKAESTAHIELIKDVQTYFELEDI